MIEIAPSDVVRYIEGWIGAAELNSTPEPQPIAVTRFQCAALAALIDRIPARLLAMPPDKQAMLIAVHSALMGMVEVATPSFPLSKVQPYGKTPPRIIWELLKQCPDEYPASTFKALSFITAADLRLSIETDVSAAHSALTNGELKGATVLAGAAIEALLLWALQDARVFHKLGTLPSPPATRRDLEASAWTLDRYIKAAEHAEIIGSNTKDALNLAKNYRNLIHPGRSARLGEKCNRGTAFGAIGALESLIEDLKTKLSD